jgi:hypothetical protein
VNVGPDSIPDPFKRSFPCSRCEGWMTTVHNPYYGIGQAKHRFIRICDKCDFAVFIPEALVKQAMDVRARRTTANTPSAPVRKSWFGKKKK